MLQYASLNGIRSSENDTFLIHLEKSVISNNTTPITGSTGETKPNK